MGRALRGLGSAVLVVAVTLLVGEALARFAFGVRPLTLESLVWRYHERWGWHHEPNTSDTFVKLGFEQTVHINSRGLREREIPYAKPDDVYRVLVIGDSAVVSFEVPPETVFTRVAEDRLRERGYPVQVVNGGCRGYGTDQALLFLQDEGMRYQPDLVLYNWIGNDAEDNVTIHRPFRRYGKPWFDLDARGALELNGVPVPSYPYTANLRVGEDGEPLELEVPPRTAAVLWLRDLVICNSSFATGLLKLAIALPDTAGTLVSMGSYDDTRDVESGLDRTTRLFRVTAAMVDAMRSTAAAGGAEFRLIGAGKGWPPALRAALDIPDLGELPRFRAAVPEDEPIHVPYDPHWNERGHRIYGEALADALAASGLLESARAGSASAR